MPRYDRIIWMTFTSWFGWVYPTTSNSTTEDITSDWQYLMDATEELARTHDERRAAEMRTELARLNRMTNSISYRTRINEWVRVSMEGMPKETLDILNGSRLDASKRDKICRDLIRSVATFWLYTLRVHFAELTDEFDLRWYEQPYKKNICGSLVAMSFHASHPANQKGLSVLYIRDILWSIYLCLSREITNEIARSLTIDENDLLLDLVMSLLPNLIQLWKITAESVGSIADREGKLPSRWEQLEKREKERLNEIKKAGVNARYNDGPFDDLVRSAILERKAKERIGLAVNEVKASKAFLDKRDLLTRSLSLRIQPASCK